ncbi:MAG TPA: hypothetical protein VK595_02025 [Vicinamibacterales bacterium]|nr:hypothetical protein [Vicinamibacterales bacterium]
MMATAVITAPRPRETLSLSLRSYRLAGFDNAIRIFADGPVSTDTDALHITRNDPPLGNLRNWHLALQTLEIETDADWLMVCEDDIEWVRGACAALIGDLRSLEQSRVFQRAGALSLYLPRRHTKNLPMTLSPGWHGEGLQRGIGAWGAQCLLFSRAQARALLADTQFNQYLQSKMDKNVDAIVAKCINDCGREILYRVPCLVDHSLGEGNSSLGYKDDRPNLRTNYFTGQP